MEWLSIVIIAVVIIAAVIFLVYKIKKDGLRKVAIEFIVMAEEKFEYGKNSAKFNYVFDAVYKLIPNWLKFLFTKENVINFIQNVFDEIKIALDYPNTQK